MGGQVTKARLVIQAGSSKVSSPTECFVFKGILWFLEEACFLCSDMDFCGRLPSSSNRVALFHVISSFFFVLIWRFPLPATGCLWVMGKIIKIKATQIFGKLRTYGNGTSRRLEKLRLYPCVSWDLFRPSLNDPSHWPPREWCNDQVSITAFQRSRHCGLCHWTDLGAESGADTY